MAETNNQLTADTIVSANRGTRLLKPLGNAQHRPKEPLITCEICGIQREMRYMQSIAWGYRVTGNREGYDAWHYPSFQCRDEQHWGCCHEHALLAMLLCLFEHMDDSGNYRGQGNPLEHDLLVRLRNDLQQLEMYERGNKNNEQAQPLVVEGSLLTSELAPRDDPGETTPATTEGQS